METTCCQSDRTNDEPARRAEAEAASLRALTLDTVQLNMGLRCNMACRHCHQSSSPTRPESMSDDVVAEVVEFVSLVRPALVDITGGAPELHPRLRWLVERLTELGVESQVRTNLTVLLTEDAADLPDLFASHRTRVLASVPSVDPHEYQQARGPSLEAAIEGLHRLNRAGYGTDPALRLDLAVNVERALAPEAARTADLGLRHTLAQRYGIAVSNVVRIVDMPLGREGERLRYEGSAQARLDEAEAEFNPETLASLPCRHGLEVAWDGRLSDCDFNLAAGLGLAAGLPRSLNDVVMASDPTLRERLLHELRHRPVKQGAHCAVCTAGAGSS